MLRATTTLFFITAIFSSTIAAETFDAESYYRQQNAADSTFENFDKEFAEPEKPELAPATPKAVHEHNETESNTAAATRQQAEQLFNSPGAVEINGFKFSLIACKLQNRNVRCEIKITSIESDRNLIIQNNINAGWQPHSSFYDNAGNQFSVSSLRLGNKEVSGKSLSGKLVTGVATKLSIVFEKVSSETTSVSLLDLDAISNNKTFKVQFRDIPLI